MKYRGRPIMAAISGFFFGFFLGLDLLLFGAIPLKSPLLTILPIVGLLGGIALAMWAPLGRKRAAGGAAGPSADTTA